MPGCACVTSLESTATAWYLGELADRAVEERAGAHPIYGLLRRACQLLDDGMAPGRVARWYEGGLADALGVRPELDRCVECHRVLEEDDTFRWVPALGGVLCGAHPGPPAESVPLSLAALKLLKAYRRLDVEAIAALRLAPAVEVEAEAVMRRYTRFILEREARSLAFMDEVRHRRGGDPAGRRGHRPLRRRLEATCVSAVTATAVPSTRPGRSRRRWLSTGSARWRAPRMPGSTTRTGSRTRVAARAAGHALAVMEELDAQHQIAASSHPGWYDGLALRVGLRAGGRAGRARPRRGSTSPDLGALDD